MKEYLNLYRATETAEKNGTLQHRKVSAICNANTSQNEIFLTYLPATKIKGSSYVSLSGKVKVIDQNRTSWKQVLLYLGGGALLLALALVLNNKLTSPNPIWKCGILDNLPRLPSNAGLDMSVQIKRCGHQ